MDAVFKDWTIKECIGDGAFGKVYRIEREDFGHIYESALKVINVPQNQSEVENAYNDGMDAEGVRSYFYGMVEDIVEEFALMAKLKGNSNIVSYEDHAVVERKDAFGWTIYIRMELLIPFYKFIKVNSLKVSDVVQLGIDICKALEICQKYRIIHRDVKPENIFVSDIGTYKLGDFGIARELEKTSIGLSKKGTLLYMAPEVFKGIEYNRTVDIYSLGIVLYRFLNNNRMPFMPPVSESIKPSDKERSSSMLLTGQEIPKPANAEGMLADIVLKACSYIPSERYEDAASFRKDLEKITFSPEEDKLIFPDGAFIANKTLSYKTTSRAATVAHSIEDESITFDDNHIENGTVHLFSDNNKKSNLGSEKQDKKDYNDYIAANDDVDSKPADSVPKDIKKKRNYKPVIIALFVTLALIVCGISAFIIYNKSSEDVVMPELTGKSYEDALLILNDYDIDINRPKKEYSNDVSKDAVISQSIKSGTILEGGETLDMVVSLGIEMVNVPEVVNLSYENAENAIKSTGLTVVKEHEDYSESVEEGHVVSQNPVASSSVEIGSEVKLNISLGPLRYKVPDVVNLKKAKAKKALEQAKMKINIKEEYNSYYKAGVVVSQSIAAGSSVKEGKKITIVVSKGDWPVETTKAPATTYYNSSNNSSPTTTKKSDNNKSNNDSSDEYDDFDLSDW